jgi:hypothetical protein
MYFQFSNLVQTLSIQNFVIAIILIIITIDIIITIIIIDFYI